MDTNVSRRSFVKTAAAGVAAASAIAAPAAARAYGANSRLRIGFIGPGGRGFGAHVKTLAKLHKEGAPVDLVAVSEVYKEQENEVCDYIKKETGRDAKRLPDYRELLAGDTVDAVCIGTPDHWHAKQTIDALKAGKHVYCEKPMTKQVQEAMDVVDAWRSTGKIMQVGVQSTSLKVWDQARELIDSGKLGKVLGFQTEYFRNSNVGQWRYYKLTKDMSPKTIDWKRWLGVEEGLAPMMDFDRAVYAQWRCYWPFGSGMFTDLFVHRTTSMLKATGLRFPARVVGAGGIYLELDGRDVPDVATVVADYSEGCQGLITATMCNEASRIKQVIRGHNGAFEFGNGEQFESFDFVAERPQVTLDSKIKDETIKAADGTGSQKGETTYLHFKNWLDAIAQNNQQLCNNPPDLGAAAITTVNLGAQSYRDGKVFFFDKETRTVRDADGSWSKRWEKLSHDHGKPHHVPGWQAGDTGSTLKTPEYMNLAGAWKNGVPPEDQKKVAG
ncbi:MAG TPA: Gfo/Idh/MocA family oxidoreductase [Pirellulales bacterium]|jgi:predicted dehydrogenase|nr:Gfo/Idh/MocA family oxidoreductase [Pirellulales bacterium]